jgi:hypothetical protein
MNTLGHMHRSGTVIVMQLHLNTEAEETSDEMIGAAGVNEVMDFTFRT